MLVTRHCDLSRLSLGRRLTRLRHDAGSTLVTVLIVMLVLTTGGVAIAGIAMNTATMVVTSKDRTSAQAVVDGAIASLTVDLMNGTIPCNPSAPVVNQPGKNGTEPTSPTYNWSLACTVDGTVGEARLSAASNVDGQKAVREAVFSYSVTTVEAADFALMTKSPLTVSPFKITQEDPDKPADIFILPDAGNGDFGCHSSGGIHGSVYAPMGAMSSGGACVVKGDVHVKGNINLPAGVDITGDVTSDEGSVTLAGGAKVGGNIYAKQDINISGGGTVGGNVASFEGGVTLSGGPVVQGNVYAKTNVVLGTSSHMVRGTVQAHGNVTVSGGSPTVTGTIIYGGSFSHPANPSADSAWVGGAPPQKIPAASQGVFPTAPVWPPTPSWVEFTPDKVAALTSGGGFTKLTWSGACTYSWWPLPTMPDVINGLTTPTVIDATGCSRLDLNDSNVDIALKTDVVFVSNSFNIGQRTIRSADGAPHKIWFITPYTAGRNCTGTNTNINVQGTKMSDSLITGLLYTQCAVHFANSGENWRGAVYSGQMTGSPAFRYSPISLPGMPVGGTPVGGTPGGSGSPDPTSFVLQSSQDLPVS